MGKAVLSAPLHRASRPVPRRQAPRFRHGAYGARRRSGHSRERVACTLMSAAACLGARCRYSLHLPRSLGSTSKRFLALHQVAQARRQIAGAHRSPPRPHRGTWPDGPWPASPWARHLAQPAGNGIADGGVRIEQFAGFGQCLPNGAGCLILVRAAGGETRLGCSSSIGSAQGEGSPTASGSSISRRTSPASLPAASNSRRSKLLDTWMSMDGLVVGSTPSTS